MNCKPCVLLVEDDAQIRTLFKRNLGGFDFLDAPNLAHALSCLKIAREDVHAMQFDLIVLDLGLPDSPESTTKQSVLEVCGDIPVVIFSGLADADATGAADFILKGSFNWSHITDRLIKAIEGRKTCKIWANAWKALDQAASL